MWSLLEPVTPSAAHSSTIPSPSQGLLSSLPGVTQPEKRPGSIAQEAHLPASAAVQTTLNSSGQPEHGADAAAQDKDGTTPLHLVSGRGRVDLARLLIECSADAEAQSEEGMTSLHLASKGGHVDLARLLIERGAHPEAQSKDGTTPLHLASEGGHVDLARLLIEHRADLNVWGKDRTTPLHLASKGGHVDLARLLTEHGADAAALMPQKIKSEGTFHGV